MASRILLVEDDLAIIEALTELLMSEGYAVDHAATQDDAIERALAGCSPNAVSPAGPGLGHLGTGSVTGAPYQLVLLDLTLAKGNGFAVCSAIKQATPSVPVIFLTASDDEFSTVTGIQMGADDYVAKPFRPRELLARIAAAIRRSQPQRRIIEFGPLHIDTDRARVERAGQDLTLSALEYRLLLLFATNQGKLITRDRIRDTLWDDAGTYIEENTLSVYIKRLRDKIEDDPAHPTLIATVRGLGYQARG
ncbi:response regulator transcription factor [Collinsella sp. An2]|uniref:response regulator transcription factor n=1 Tax=Collinsella sp. An2 TaxID=1965585 RepID=UPI000B383A58|nr:response regulator transcription factor [Collinsella sp. An2]OUP10092.1 DNA-binding response regulator [Collinsella sp. An2]